MGIGVGVCEIHAGLRLEAQQDRAGLSATGWSISYGSGQEACHPPVVQACSHSVNGGLGKEIAGCKRVIVM